MKTRTIIFSLATILLLSLTTCKKDPQPIMECFDLSREDLTVGTTSASIVGTYAYSGAIDKINVLVSEDGVHSKEFAADINGKNYTVELTELSPATHYQYNYSIDYGFSKPYITDAKYFTTLNETPTVHTIDIINIDSTTVRVNCEVVSDGGISIMEMGVCWNTYGNPNLDDEKLAYSEAGMGEFSCRISGLSPYTNYHVKAYAINSSGISYGEEIVFSTLSTGYTVAISVTPENSGTVTGGGVYYEGQNCIVVAQANSGFAFSHWSEGETQVSSEALYSFVVTGNRNLVAHFVQQQPDSYYVNVSTNNNEGGSAIGGGLFQFGQTCTIMASVCEGYTFVNWTEGGTEVSTEAIYTFEVTRNRVLVANFFFNYNIVVSAVPHIGGIATGGGVYYEGQVCNISAVASDGYEFKEWFENYNYVSSDPQFSFVVTSNRDIKACFDKENGNNNNDCWTAKPICLENGVFELLSENDGYTAEPGPDYNCLATQPNPRWFYLRVESPGDMDILIEGVEQNDSIRSGRDVDFCCWGPFDELNYVCDKLTSDKVISCSYSASPIEHCIIPSSSQFGEYYFLLVTNYSNTTFNIRISRVNGVGTTDCGIISP